MGSYAVPKDFKRIPSENLIDYSDNWFDEIQYFDKTIEILGALFT